jgi:glycosyltransferase involved in cell wall biosynthesis
VFNLFWKTKGGGEMHALSLARLLADRYPDRTVYLLSESDFDLEELGRYFGIDTQGLRKLILARVTPAITGRFWLFVNATSHSSLPSRAENSWYVVSFPHRVLSRRWLAGYTLLYNSEFTQSWCRRWWTRRSPGAVLHPILHLRSRRQDQSAAEPPVLVRSEDPGRSRCVVALGRFTRRGHSKNHDVIISAFTEAFHASPSNWSLSVIGSLELDQPDDFVYFQELRMLADPATAGCRIELHPDFARPQLEAVLETALVYVHAAGYGKHPRREPELHEHFGIAPVEAALKGCIPVVYAIGGPAEFVSRCGIGRTYRTREELTAILIELAGRDERSLLEESLETAQRARSWVDRQTALPLPSLRPFRVASGS